MDSKDARNRLLLIARERLRNRPGDYEKFVRALADTVQGQAFMRRAQTIPFAWEEGERCGSQAATEKIAEHLVGVVDWWAQSQPSAQTVAPLPTATLHPQASNHNSDVMQRNDPEESLRLVKVAGMNGDLLLADDADDDARAFVEKVNAERAQHRERESKRIAEGRYFIEEAAQAIAQQRGKSPEWAQKFCDQMFDAAKSGELTVRDRDTWLPLPAKKVVSLACIVFRDDLNSWLDAQGAGYRLDDGSATAQVKAMVISSGEIAAATETPKQRRARLLKWREEETELGGAWGSLNRVVAREKVLRPSAERSNVGKEIKKAEAERAEESRAGPFDALVSTQGSSARNIPRTR
jgi:hypothetical protein